jgi:diguanylate cyclase (GGDEF)-like protein/PAS domain S-box-containing protein
MPAESERPVDDASDATPCVPDMLGLAFADSGNGLFRAIAQSSPAGICVIRWTDRKVVWANHAFRQMLNMSLRNTDVSGLPVNEVIEEFAASGLAGMADEVAKTGQSAAMAEYECSDPHGGSCYIDWTLSRLPLAQCREPILMLYAIDVTASITSRHNAGRLREEAEQQRQAVDKHREMLDTVLSNTTDRHYVHDLQGRFIYANKTMCARLGTTCEQLVGKRMEDFPYPPEWFEMFNRNLAEIKETKRAVRGVFYMHVFTEQPEWFEYHTIPVLDEEGRLQLIAGNSRDITSQKQAEIALRQALERLSLAMEATALGTFDYYPAKKELVWNETTRRHWGVPDNMPVSLDLYYNALCAEYREPTALLIAKALHPSSGGKYRNEYRIRRISDGRERWIRATGQTIFNEHGEAIRFIGTSQDVTETKEVEQRIIDASKHDILTGLPNRALVYEYGGHLLALAERTKNELAMLFIDLDRFKPINDQYGHEVGDKVLRETARRIAACTRKADIVGRLGGDEFLVILSHLEDERGAQAVAEHIVRTVEQPIRVGDVDHVVSCSIGISLFPQHGSDTEGLIRAADLAMYAAKAAGRNGHVLFTIGLEAEFQERVQLEQWLRHVVKRRELYLLYQPIVDLASQEVVGVEALVRLPYGNGVYYSPDQFISVAETAGLIDLLGTWVIEEACRQHRRWCEQGLPPLRISVNVSPLQFQQKNFADHLITTVENMTSDPSCIEIEVTESTVMESLGQTIDTLSRIRKKGIRIALDDFGTGYSSLSQLACLPLDKLKIDQSFVKRLATDPSSKAIAEMIIVLGKTMDLEIVGEGIEKAEDLETLRDLGCEKGQGYLFSIPLSADAFVNWYNFWRASGPPPLQSN